MRSNRCGTHIRARQRACNVRFFIAAPATSFFLIRYTATVPRAVISLKKLIFGASHRDDGTIIQLDELMNSKAPGFSLRIPSADTRQKFIALSASVCYVLLYPVLAVIAGIVTCVCNKTKGQTIFIAVKKPPDTSRRAEA